MLMARPNLPNDHLRGGRGAPKRRLWIRQPMVMKYEPRIDTPPSELMALRAVEEPRLMHASRELMKNDRHTARSGMFHPGGTTARKSLKGRPLSLAKDHTCLEAVATSLTQQEETSIITHAVMAFVPA